MQEIEAKFLTIDTAAIEAKLQSLGATRVFDRIFRRSVYDYPDLRLNAAAAWIRVRDEGERITMGFKQRHVSPTGGDDTGMTEVEMVVDNYDAACLFLESIGMKRKFYEENHRIQYKLGDTEFDIDHWPMLEPYLEIEAPTQADLDHAIGELGLNPTEARVFSTFQIYAEQGINELDYSVITFEEQIKK